LDKADQYLDAGNETLGQVEEIAGKAGDFLNALNDLFGG
jgi:hypothetical protein